MICPQTERSPARGTRRCADRRYTQTADDATEFDRSRPKSRRHASEMARTALCDALTSWERNAVITETGKNLISRLSRRRSHVRTALHH